MTPEDQEILLMRARAGDIESLVTLLEVVGHDVRLRVASKVNPAWRALLDEDDVMQTTYLEAVTRFDRFTSGGAREFAAWLARLAENNLIDGIRALEAAKRPDPSKRVSGKRSAEDSMSSLVTVLGVTLTTPSTHAARGEADDFIAKALEVLPEDYRRVIQLYDLGGKSATEVAAELKRSEGAIYMLRARAHEQLRDVLGRESRFFSTGG
ncbi:MAG: sigma-70 family RNA polymerase sigma factor [Planctomycetes bacterium]|nr:sigma-70 family RNA polymerase sigma factor [Planctomycetota bacterium]